MQTTVTFKSTRICSEEACFTGTRLRPPGMLAPSRKWNPPPGPLVLDQLSHEDVLGETGSEAGGRRTSGDLSARALHSHKDKKHLFCFPRNHTLE
ncbi:hypothetical protein BD311DRAFT_456757 [Dichomitus squalens]|uniref:Uncharacterized protein n=1 Tax=Dichomitus squalens TaxID=114155 RepID=A0A4Q9MFL5_9APHY|nr:hypothetical protein BD311DRAFT_456757 [Dichomitus squalens]